MPIGYQLEYRNVAHSKTEIYQFCRKFPMIGSVTSNKDGNTLIEIFGDEDIVKFCVIKITDFLKNDLLINCMEISELTYECHSFLVG